MLVCFKICDMQTFYLKKNLFIMSEGKHFGHNSVIALMCFHKYVRKKRYLLHYSFGLKK